MHFHEEVSRSCIFPLILFWKFYTILILTYSIILFFHCDIFQVGIFTEERVIKIVNCLLFQMQVRGVNVRLVKRDGFGMRYKTAGQDH